MDEQIKAIDNMILVAERLARESSVDALNIAEAAFMAAQALVATSPLRPRQPRRPIPNSDTVSPGLNFGLKDE